MDNKLEHNMWHEWHLSTSELSAENMLELHRQLGSKESVINANSPRDAPRIVVDKRRYTDVAKVPVRIRSPGLSGPERSELPADQYYESNARTVSMPKQGSDYQYPEMETSFGSPSYCNRPAVERSGHSLEFTIDKGVERGSRVSAKAKVRFPSIASRLDRDSTSSRPAERDALSF